MVKSKCHLHVEGKAFLVQKLKKGRVRRGSRDPLERQWWEGEETLKHF